MARLPCQSDIHFSFFCWDFGLNCLQCRSQIGIISLLSKDILHGKWNFGFVFIIPATSMPLITLQSVPFTESITVFIAESHPKTITASYSFAYV